MGNDPIFDQLTAPGQRFALGARNGLQVFTGAPENIAELIEQSRAFGDRTFLVEGDRRLSYEDVFRLRDALLASTPIRPGDRVAIVMRNRVEWIIAFLAVMRAGGVAVLVNSRGAAGELVAALKDTSPALTFADKERAALIRQAHWTGPIVEADAFPPASAAKDPPPMPPRKSSDPAAILFTSGTTGRVKGAVLSHLSLTTGVLSMQLSGMMVLHNAAQQLGMTPAELMQQIPQQAVLVIYPLFHISGLGSALLSPMFAGGKLIFMRRWSADEALQLIAREKVTSFTAVPTMLWDLVRSPFMGKVDLSSLTNIASGGQALPINLLNAIMDACPQAMMGTGYGSTETAGAIAMGVGPDFTGRYRASAGRILPIVDVRFVDDAGQEVPPGTPGEIVARGAQVMSGYWNRPEDTARALSPDGWIKTGDIGYVNAEGYLFIVDRKKDMVISGGENIYCAEVERVLSEHPGIKECATFGVPDERMGEKLVAVIVGDIAPDDAIHWVEKRLAKYKAPQAVRCTQDPLPRNAIGKIDKIRLRKEWGAG